MSGEIFIQDDINFLPLYKRMSVSKTAEGKPALVIPNLSGGKLLTSYPMVAAHPLSIGSNAYNGRHTLVRGRTSSTSQSAIAPDDDLRILDMSYDTERLLPVSPTGSDLIPSADACKEGILGLINEGYGKQFLYEDYPEPEEISDWRTTATAWGTYFRYYEGYKAYEETDYGTWGGVYARSILRNHTARDLRRRVLSFPGIAPGTQVLCRVYPGPCYVKIYPAPNFGPSTWTISIRVYEIRLENAGKWGAPGSYILGDRIPCYGYYDYPETPPYYSFYQDSSSVWRSTGTSGRVYFQVPESRMVAFEVVPRSIDLFFNEYAVSKLNSSGAYQMSDLQMSHGDTTIQIDRIYTP